MNLLQRLTELREKYFTYWITYFFFYLSTCFISVYYKWMGATQVASGKESAYWCRRHGFDLWDGKISWSRKWQLTPVFFPGKFHGQWSLAGYSP